MALLTVVVAGGTVAHETMASYVERALGKDVVLVAKPEIIDRYTNRLQVFTGHSDLGETNFLDSNYTIPSSDIEQIRGVQGVISVDPRLILETEISEVQFIMDNHDKPGSYIIIGGHRKDTAVIMGVHFDSLVNDWMLTGQVPAGLGQNDALIGDSLASALFEDPWLQGFKALNYEFKIGSICLDPLNSGFVAYVSHDRLGVLTSHSGYNVLFLKIDSADRSSILAELESKVSASGFSVLDMNEAIGWNNLFLDQVWSLLLAFSLVSFASAVSSLAGYMMISLSDQRRDFGIMRSLGAKPRTVLKVVLVEALLLVLAGVAIGFPVGLVVVFGFFIPEPVITQWAIVSTVSLISVLATVLCLSSLVSARRTAKMPITQAVAPA